VKLKEERRIGTRKVLRFRLGTQYSVLITLVVALATAGCGARRTPNLTRVFAGARELKGKRPVIVIPGVLGSRIVNRRTGEVVWPSVFRSDVDGLSLPTTPDLASNQDELVAARIVEAAKLGGSFGPEVYVYHYLIRALEDYGGYREGDWDNPPEGGDRDTFYVFPYDWRRDNVESARLLAKRVEALKLKLGRPELRFNVVAHSMGGLVARYAAMYGDRDLPPAGEAPRPDWAGASFVDKIFMFGTPNEGSMEALSVLLEGYSVTEGLRRRVRLLNKLSREDVMTVPSLFQLLPHRGQARFLDQDLRPLSVDLYDPATWRRYGWTAANDASFREAYARGAARDEEAPGRHGTLAELDAYLGAVLERARRFHEALDAPGVVSADAPVKLFAFGGDCEETLAAPVLLRDEKAGRWLTLTRPKSLKGSDGRRFKRAEVVNAMYAPGDGRVTRDSLMGLGLAGTRASDLYQTSLPVAYAVFACDLHSELQNNRTLQDNALTLLVNELAN
jgi:pimeloyl-ACP methyl ester carboxylesterase